jgi:uncharacterized membrane protein YkoI
MRRVLKQAALAAVAGIVLAATPAAAGCLPWKAAARVISQNGLVSGNAVYGFVQSRLRGKIIQASLCDQGGRFFYRLVVLGPQGDVTNVIVDARTGQF